MTHVFGNEYFSLLTVGGGNHMTKDEVKNQINEIVNELYHHGIKGQKWGVRRYQNYDGSYTDKGRKRYNIGKSNKQKAKIEKIKEKINRFLEKQNQYEPVMRRNSDLLFRIQTEDHNRMFDQFNQTLVNNTFMRNLENTTM